MARKRPVLFGVVITACVATLGMAVIASDDEINSTNNPGHG